MKPSNKSNRILLIKKSPMLLLQSLYKYIDEKWRHCRKKTNIYFQQLRDLSFFLENYFLPVMTLPRTTKKE